MELAGLQLPDHLQGVSFVPSLGNPDISTKDAVFPRWKTADSIRTERYYYTEWRNKGNKVIANTLYDHQLDPDECVNVAGHPDYADITKELSLRLEQHIEKTGKP